MSTAHFVLMAKNNAWANATLYDAVAKLSLVDFTAPRPGFFPSLCATLNHILLVDFFYLSALEGAPQSYGELDRPDVEDPAAMAAEQASADARLIALCEGLTDGSLTEMRDTVRDSGRVAERVDALLLHLFQHQVHHRGQAHVQLQDAGVKPPQLDDFHLEYGRVPSAKVWIN
ncbi:DinB family protein [Algicella marina]|uniref:Nuclease n=1 Tax=Algicella marina TaxID=2683284 RepID=A0A6P1T0J3_9RHOB|nr:DinB family protein [Algicella marina]QHQ35517.1 nuclease [Algicella marina]